MFDWMAWTPPVAVFFGGIGLLLAGMTAWEIRTPSVMRRGFLPIATTRGDRLFIGLLCVAFTNLAFIAIRTQLTTALSLAHEPSMWVGFGVSLLLLALVMRKG